MIGDEAGIFGGLKTIKGSLSKGNFKGRRSAGSRLLVFLGTSFVQILRQIVKIREKIISNTNLLASRHIQRENASLLADVRRSKAPLLMLPKSVTKTRPTEMRTWSILRFQ